MAGLTTTEKLPLIADHQMLRLIATGSYGAVWLARSVVGTYRAVKIVYRRNFDNERPYEREFRGIRYFEPISRTHDSFVAILQIGRNDPEEYFYYVMEIADDIERGTNIDPEHYSPRTLSSELERRGRLPLKECLQLGLSLTAGLGHLHHQHLVHRDIKPSNIIFVNGRAKIADLGLVTDVRNTTTLGGTVGYLPEHGPGTPSADLYSLGKVLYEMSTGKDRLEYPALPTDIDLSGNLTAMRQLNDIILKACDPNPRARFQSARELFDELSRIEKSTHNENRPEEKWFRALWAVSGPPAPVEQPRLEAIGGAIPLDSAFYIERSADQEFEAAIGRSDSIILVKGARQMGKTSLLARGLQQARDAGAQVIMTDLQELNDSDLNSLKDFYIALANEIADQLELEELLSESWDERRSPNHNFERYFRRTVLSQIAIHVFWGLDEVDRLFTTNFGGQVFGMFRAWHNRRALDPGGPWSKLTLAIAYATEAHLFITDLNQSPFNVGTRIILEDFTLEQVTELNHRYGDPLRDQKELNHFIALLGGQPYLTRRAFHELVTRDSSYDVFETAAEREEGIFGDHLRRILLSLRKDANLIQSVTGVLTGQPCPAESFYRLRSAGVLAGDSAKEARPRCQLYSNYLKQHL